MARSGVWRVCEDSEAARRGRIVGGNSRAVWRSTLEISLPFISKRGQRRHRAVSSAWNKLRVEKASESGQMLTLPRRWES